MRLAHRKSYRKETATEDLTRKCWTRSRTLSTKSTANWTNIHWKCGLLFCIVRAYLLILLTWHDWRKRRLHRLEPQAGAVSVRRKCAEKVRFSTAGLVANSKHSSISAERLHRLFRAWQPLHKFWMWTCDRQFFPSLLRYMYDVGLCARLQPYWRKNIGSQPNFSRIFFTYRDNSARPNISRFFSSHPYFKKKSAWGTNIVRRAVVWVLVPLRSFESASVDANWAIVYDPRPPDDWISSA